MHLSNYRLKNRDLPISVKCDIIKKIAKRLLDFKKPDIFGKGEEKGWNKQNGPKANAS